MATSPKRRWSWLRWLLFAALGVIAFVAIAVIFLFRAAQTAPAFYTQVIEIDPQRGGVQARELETHLLDLNNDVRREDRWQLTLSADEVNGWLATTLPDKFPHVLPPEAKSPRVAIDPQLIQLACKYEGRGVTSVLSIGLEPSLLAEPNTVALRIRHVRAGILPIPVKQFLNDIAQRAIKGGLHVRWDEVEGDPVAILRLDADPKRVGGRQVILDTLEVQSGQITFGGTSAPQ